MTSTKRRDFSPWITQGALAAVAALGVALAGTDDPVALEVLAGASFGALVASGVGLVICAADEEESEQRGPRVSLSNVHRGGRDGNARVPASPERLGAAGLTAGGRGHLPGPRTAEAADVEDAALGTDAGRPPLAASGALHRV